MISPHTILLVEDDHDDQELFISALSGIENATLFDVVENGKEAIERLHELSIPPAIIFMDINMPVMSGIECLTIIANDPLMNGIPVIMLSSDIGQREKAQEVGANGFIKKPDSVQALREELKHALFNVDNVSCGNGSKMEQST